MNALRRTLNVTWPILLLAAFVTTFRRVPTEAASAAEAINCDGPSRGSQTEGAVDLTMLERCVTLDPGNVELLVDLGAAYEGSSRWDLAEATYRRALAVDPRDSTLHLRLGTILLRRGDRAGAQKEAQLALQWHPNSAAALDLDARAAAGADR